LSDCSKISFNLAPGASLGEAVDVIDEARVDGAAGLREFAMQMQDALAAMRRRSAFICWS
jgi:hypothetical protein